MLVGGWAGMERAKIRREQQEMEDKKFAEAARQAQVPRPVLLAECCRETEPFSCQGIAREQTCSAKRLRSGNWRALASGLH
jgi:hypothetical protein